MTTPKTKKPASKVAAKPEAQKPARASASPPMAEKKTDKLVALLKREGGASLNDITGATGWLPHSARAMLTGLRKKGFTLEKSKVDGVTCWSITGEPAA